MDADYISCELCIIETETEYVLEIANNIELGDRYKQLICVA